MADRLHDEAVHDTAIRRLQSAYADIVNRRAWDELVQIFSPRIPIRIAVAGRDPVELEGPGGFADFVGPAMAPFVFFEFVILNSRISFVGNGFDAATARMFMTEIRQDAEGQQSQVYGLYRDRYVRNGDRWWFAAREYSTLARAADPAGPLEVFDLPDVP